MIRDSAHVGGGRGVAEAGCVLPGHVVFLGTRRSGERPDIYFEFAEKKAPHFSGLLCPIAMGLPQNWEEKVSRSTGVPYFFNT